MVIGPYVNGCWMSFVLKVELDILIVLGTVETRSFGRTEVFSMQCQLEEGISPRF